jgi:putative ABC transport system permease protein
VALARLVLGVLALGLGGGAVLGTQLAAGALQRQTATAVRERAGAAEYDIQPFNAPGFTGQQVEAISKLAAVTEASPLEEKADLAELPSHGFRQVLLIVAGRDGVALRPLPVVRGSRPRSLHQIAVSQHLSPGISVATGAKTPGKVGIGQNLELVKSAGVGAFRVVGVVSDASPGAPFTEDAVYITPAAARSLFAAGLQVRDVAVRLRRGATVGQLLRELSSSVHTQYTISDPRALPDSDPAGELRPILDAITALSLVLAFAVIAATFSSVVLDRRREIGLVRLAGASRGLIFRSFLREAGAASAVGAALGVGVGYLLAEVLLSISSPSGVSPLPRVQPDPGWTLAAFLLVLLLGLDPPAGGGPAAGRRSGLGVAPAEPPDSGGRFGGLLLLPERRLRGGGTGRCLRLHCRLRRPRLGGAGPGPRAGVGDRATVGGAGGCHRGPGPHPPRPDLSGPGQPLRQRRDRHRAGRPVGRRP